jgi:hypothetical protein
MGGDDTPDRRRYHRTMPDDEDKDVRLSADRMSRLAYRAILFIVCAACSALSLGQEVERPNWAPNDTWTFRGWELPAVWEGGGRLPYGRKVTIVGVRPTHYVAAVLSWQEYATRETTSLQRNLSRNLNRYFREDPTLPWTELEFLRWPLVVGKSWNFTHPMPDGSKFEWLVTVAGWEEISVPAGKFKTMVIKVEGASGAHHTDWRTLWYSPDAKAVVRYEWRGYVRATHKAQGEFSELESFSVK